MAGLFMKSQSTTEPKLNSIQVNQSVYGACVPLVYGTQRIPVGLIWYNSFIATPHTQRTGGKGGGGSKSTSYTYTAALILQLCEGAASTPIKVWADKEQKSLAELNLTFEAGGSGPSIWSFLTTNYPSQAIPYDHTAKLYSSAFDLGSSAALPNLTVEQPGFFAGSASPIAISGDVEPSTILLDYCGDANHGCNFPYLDTGIQGAGVTTYQSYCIAMGFYMSPMELTQRAARDFIAEMLDITNSEAVWSAGILKIIPRADASVSGNGRTYTPDLTPLFAFTDDDYLTSDSEDPLKQIQANSDEIFNRLRIEYRNRANAYNSEPATAEDADDIAIRGERTAPNIRFDAITLTTVARTVGQLKLQKQLYYRNKYEFRVRSDYCLLEPMDIVTITDSTLGLFGITCRVLEVEDSEEDELRLLVEELPVGPGGAPVYAWDSAQGYAANWNFAPGAINAPVFFMAPQALCQSPNQAELWCAISGPSTWGGCYVWLSMDNINYRLAGTITGPARHGTLTASLAAGADPDSSHTLSVLLANTALSIAAGSTSDADNLRTLLWVDGEIMSYRDATLTGTGAYNLGYLRRGKYGSANAAHSSATQWARLDSAIFRIPIDPGMMGQLMYLKFQPFNTVGRGLVDIASVSAYSRFLNPTPMNSPGFRMLNSSGAMVTGNTFYKTNAGTANTWSDAVWSTDGYSNGCIVSCHAAPPIAAELMLGLALNPTASVSYTNLAFALYLQSGTLKVYEAGALKATIGSYAERDQLAIQYDGQFVRYYQNQVCVYSTFAPGLKLFLQCCLYTIGATVTDVSFSPFSGESVSTADSIAFLDTFEHQNYKAFYYDAGSGSPTIDYPADGVAGGRVIRTAGAQAWKVHGQNIPYDSAQLYKITTRVRRTVAASVPAAHSSIYVGVTAVAADGVTLLNTVGANSESSQHYVCLAGFDLSAVGVGTWVDGVGYFSGNAAWVAPSTDPAAPAGLYTGTRYFRPLFIMNYAAGDGTMEIDFIKVEKLPSVSTPQIDPHAVTDVASATNASTDVYTSGTTPTQVMSVAVGPYPYATEMIVTATGRVDHNLTAGHQSSTYASITDFTTSSSIGGSDTIIARNPNTTDTRVQQSYSLEKRYSIAANTSKTFYLYGQGASISAAGSTCLLLDSLLKVEVIKK